MNCDSARTMLDDHVEGLLLPLDEAAMKLHLGGCAACAREVAEQRALTAALDGLPEPALPSSFAHGVMSQLSEMLPAAEGRRHLMRWGAVTAVAAFAFLAALALLVEGAGPSVAHEVLDPLAASLTLAGLLVGAGATLAASFLKTLAGALVTTDLALKLAFCAIFVAINAALVMLLSRVRPVDGPGNGRGH